MLDNDKQSLLAAWLEGRLSAAQRDQFERLCLEDETFAQRVETAGRCSAAGENFAGPAVPAWDKSATFITANKPHRYQWLGLPMASMAMSVVAMMMVVSGFSVDMSNDRLSFGFGDSLDESEITALVSEKVEHYKNANQAVFREYADALASQQRQSSAELTEYLLASSRKERREDFAELVKFINQQRTDDQRFYARQLHNLQQDVSALESNQSMSPLTSYPDATPEQ